MGSMTRRGFLTLVVLGVAALAPGGCGGDKPQSIKVVIAEYSRDHTRPFWQALADQYTKQTGVKVDLQVIDWNSDRSAGQHHDPEQPAARRAQPQLVLQLRQGRPPLFGRRGPVAQDAGRFPRSVRARRHLSRQALRLPDPGQRARVLLQPRPARPGRGGRAAADLGRVRVGREAGAGPGGRDDRLRAAARAGGGAGRVVHLDVEQRRRLEERRGVDDQQRRRTCRRSSSWPRSPTRTR